MPLITVPLLGYAPDLDPATPGALFSANGMEATEFGWIVSKTGTVRGLTKAVAANSYLIDAALTYPYTNGLRTVTVAYYDGTAAKTKLLVAKGDSESTFTDASRAGNYTATDNFSFCQYGDYTIATNLTDVVQIRDATSSATAFADSAATGIPKAKIAVTWGPPTSPRVMLLHYNDGTAYPDGWWTSHQGGPTAAWTPDIATGASNGRLIGANPITCGIALGDNIVVFSLNQMWLGRFVGPPTVVEWQRISTTIGCSGMYAATVANDMLYFVNAGGLYQFDGNSRPQLVDAPIQSAIRTMANYGGYPEQLKWITLTTDRQRKMLNIALRHTPPTPSVPYAYKLNLSNMKAGNIAAVSTGKVWIDENWTLTIPANTITLSDNQNERTPVVGDNVGFILNYIGANKGDTKVIRVIPRFWTLPTSYTAIDNFYAFLGDNATAHPTVTVSAAPWRADLLKTARWHLLSLYFAGAPNIIDVMVEVEKAGNA